MLLTLLDRPGTLKKRGGYNAEIAAKASGVNLSFEWSDPSWVLNSAALFADGIDGFRRFPDVVVGGVPIAARRADVQAALGRPSRSGGGGPPVMKVLIDYPWDRFDFPSHSVRFDYDDANGNVRIVSLMTRELMLKLNPTRA